MSDYNHASCPLFIHLRQNEIDAILERAVAEERRVEKDNYVVRQGDTINHLYLLMEGLVRTLGEMIREGWISLYKRELKVLERSKLEGLV